MNDIFSSTNRNIFIPLLAFFLLLSSLSLGYGIVYKNHNVFFFISAVFLLFVILRSNIVPFMLIFLFIVFSEWAVEYGMLPPHLMWIPELLNAFLFAKMVVNKIINRQKIKLFGIWIVLGVLFVTLLSFLINKVSIISVLLFLRLLFRYYLLFLVVINLDLEEKNMKLMNNFFIFIFLSQLPLSTVKLFIPGYGPGEKSLGLSSHALSTIVPLIAIGFLISYYFLYKRLKIYILITLAYVGFSIIGSKRAFIFFLAGFLIFLSWFLRKSFKDFLRYTVLGILIFSISSYFVIRLIPSLNPQRRVWGEFNPGYVINFAYEYTTRTRQGLSRGRTASTIQVFRTLHDRGSTGILFGFGPGSIMKSMFETVDKSKNAAALYGVGYGLSGVNWLGLQVGYLGVFLFFLLIYKIYKRSVFCFNKEQSAYWRSFGLGMTAFSFLMLVMGLFYSSYFKNDAMSAIYFFLAGFIIKRAEFIGN